MGKSRILLVEDDADIVDVIQIILQGKGYDVECHLSGHHIMEKDFSLPDLFIIDGNLPGYNGIQICEYLKSQSRTKDLPIIFMSASKDFIDEAREKCLAQIIEKPFDTKKLLSAVESSIKQQPVHRG